MQRVWRSALGCLFALAAVAWTATYVEPLPHYRAAVANDLGDSSFAAFYATKLRDSAREGVAAGNEERWIERTSYSELALLYIHGFGASRADGEYVVERLAAATGSNAYLMRLPGHGSRMQDLERFEFDAYLRASDDALRKVAAL